MSAEQLRHLIDTYGFDKLLTIELNNSKRIHLDKEVRDKNEVEIIWDKELVKYKNKVHGITNLYFAPFAIIEGVIFKDGEQFTFEMDGNDLAKGEDGKLISNNW